MAKIPTVEELETVFNDCAKASGRGVALQIFNFVGATKTGNVADVPEPKRFLTLAALERRPKNEEPSASNDNIARALAEIGAAAFKKNK
jgi:hypothetical protein